MKICTKCKKQLPDESFSLKGNSPTLIAKRCDRCRNSRAVLWNKEHKDKVRISQIKFQESGKARKGRLLKKFNITEEDYNQLFEKQGHGCAICGSNFSKGKYSNFNVDHNHKTGEVRGLLCGNCNRGIGYFKDNIKTLEKAIHYLS